MNEKFGMTKSQIVILFLLVTTIILTSMIGIKYLLEEKDNIASALYPNVETSTSIPLTPYVETYTLIPLTPSNTYIAKLPTLIILNTETPLPTFAYVSTSTPIPSRTPFALPEIPQVNNSGNYSSNYGIYYNCSSYLEYADAMHQYYLDSIDYVHNPSINYYQSQLQEMAADRDTGGMVSAQRGLNNEMAQVAAEKNSENARYEAEIANINANCR